MNGDAGTAAYFDALYAGSADPWAFETSSYERAKYAATLAALPRARCERMFEVGCSIGVLTHALAGRCGALLAVDISEAPLLTASSRCAALPHVRFARMQIPDDWPSERFDLILLSEVLYYLGVPAIEATARRVVDGLTPGGAVLLVHWLGDTGTEVNGDQAAERFVAAAPELAIDHQQRTAQYRLDRLATPAAG